MKEITIAGGGLSGLSLGIGLRREGIPVDLHEASTFPRHRVCGEFISGVKDSTLDALGIRSCLSDAELLRSTAWFDPKSRFFAAELPFPARGISRYRLDDRLASLFQERGGRFLEGERLTVEDQPAEGLVVATGRPVEKGSDWLGLKAHFLDLPLEADLEMHLGEGGYVGLSRIEDGRVNVAGLFRRRPGLKAKGGDALIAYAAAGQLDGLAKRLGAASCDPASCVGVSSFGFGFSEPKRERLFRVGDQRAIIPPFTGNGMSMAIQSAELAVPSLRRFAGGETNWGDALSSYEVASRRSFYRRLLAARTMHPFLFGGFGRGIMKELAKRGLLPFSLLYRAMR